MSAKTKRGYFYESTVEITFEGKKVRVSKDVADAIKKRNSKKA